MQRASALALYPQQIRLLQAPGREVIAIGDGGGKSHAMRAAAIMNCLRYPGTTAVILHAFHYELLKTHVEGRSGLKAMLSGHLSTVTFRPGEVRFSNGSSILWLAADRPTDMRRLADSGARLFYIDDIHRLSRENFLACQAVLEVTKGRVVVAAPERSRAGWAAARDWQNEVQFSHDDLPANFRSLANEPTIGEYMDSLGVPFYASDGSFRKKPAIKKMIDVLQRWYWGEFERLFLLVPTQVGKTTLGVRIIGSYIPYCRQFESVGITCYGETKAIERSRDARDNYIRAGGRILPGSGKQAYWKTPHGGGVWGVGYGGGSGNPMSWGIIDDPDADMRDSRSKTRIEAKDEWYQYVWLGRESKHAAKENLSLLFIGTRFWAGDTTARTLKFHVERGERCHVCAIPALYDPKVEEHYRAFGRDVITIEPDFRTELNEPIDPERHGRDYWEKTKKSKLVVFLGRDQQMPLGAAGGRTFNKNWPVDLHVDPAFRAGRTESGTYVRTVRAWDFASIEGGGDYTASVKIGEYREASRYVIRHAAHGRYEPRNVLRFVAAMMLLDGSDVDVAVVDDPAAGGKQQTDRVLQYLADICRKLRVECKECYGDPKGCEHCHGGEMRFKPPRMSTVGNGGIAEYFADFASHVQPISDSMEGSVDYVNAPWTPTIPGSIPWFWRAVEFLSKTDPDWAEELREVERMARAAVQESEYWQIEYLDELHAFPDATHDDWVAATAYNWNAISTGVSLYPKGRAA